MSVEIIIGDALTELRKLPSDSVDCCVTSPPYWGLRDYGTPGQLGLEPTYQEHVAQLGAIFEEVRRVLKPTGTCWMNYGDSYATSVNGRSAADTKLLSDDDRTFRDKPFSTVQGVLKPKDLCGIPWRVAFALQERGWWLRQDIIWSKPNPMPESIRDRCTKAHEYLFLLTKRPKYYFDAEAIAEPLSNHPITRARNERADKGIVGAMALHGTGIGQSGNGGFDRAAADQRNKRSVWTVATQPFSEAHFATFPPELIEPCIKAGCPEQVCSKCGAPVVRDLEIERRPNERPIGQKHDGTYYAANPGGGVGNDRRERTDRGWRDTCGCNAPKIRGTVLDPFFGAGTTGLVADRLQRNCIGIELNPEYAAMARKRIDGDRGGLLDAMEAA